MDGRLQMRLPLGGTDRRRRDVPAVRDAGTFRHRVDWPRARHSALCASAKRCKGRRVFNHFALSLLRLPSVNPPFYRDEHLFVDLRDRVVTLDSETVTLTRKEYRLLALLAHHPGEVVPRPILLTHIRGHVPERRPSMLDVHIHGLRRKLGIYADLYIETVVGVGFIFRPPVLARD